MPITFKEEKLLNVKQKKVMSILKLTQNLILIFLHFEPKLKNFLNNSKTFEALWKYTII